MTIITNENFEDIFMTKINEDINSNPIEKRLLLIINVYICGDKTVIQLFGFKPEIFVMSGTIKPLIITRLIEKIRNTYFLSKTEFKEDIGTFRFLNEIGNVTITLNVMPRGQDKHEFIAIRDLLIGYYKDEEKKPYVPELISPDNSIDKMSKENLLLLMGKLGVDELRTLLGFLPPERIEMLNKIEFNSNDSLGRN